MRLRHYHFPQRLFSSSGVQIKALHPSDPLHSPWVMTTIPSVFNHGEKKRQTKSSHSGSNDDEEKMDYLCPKTFTPSLLWKMVHHHHHHHHHHRTLFPMMYTGERYGSWIHEIRPFNTSKSSEGTEALGLHTEMAFHYLRPSHVLLYCYQNPTHVATTFASTKNILSSLPLWLINGLRQPWYSIIPPLSYQWSQEWKTQYPQVWRPLLYSRNRNMTKIERHHCPHDHNDDDHPYPWELCLATHCDIHFRHVEAEEMYRKLLPFLEQHTHRRILQPGDVWLLNNRTMLHGREIILSSPLSLSSFSSSRWLFRMYLYDMICDMKCVMT